MAQLNITLDTELLHGLFTKESKDEAFSKWPEIFGTPTIANAILDRLLHHSHIISIKGPSYRIQSKVQIAENNTDKEKEVS